MIISAANRTDIPAFYSEWFIKRIQEKKVMVRNPYYPDQVTEYSLDPEVVDVLCFCTKNPGPMLKYEKELAPYPQYWFVTITPYGKDIEPNIPDKKAVIQSFITLSKRLGSRCMAWRYDPIFINEKYTLDYHLHAFEVIASSLAGYTNTCIISYIDLYEKVKKNFPEVKAVDQKTMLSLTEKLVKMAAKYHIQVKCCCEDEILKETGAIINGCINKEVYESVLNTHLNMPAKKPLRGNCTCFFGTDIGAYNSCLHLCKYCYANYDEKTVRQNYRQHDVNSPLLIGPIKPTDKIIKAKQASYIDKQLSLF